MPPDDEDDSAPPIVVPAYRQRRELPWSSQPAIAHPATGRAIRLRLRLAALLIVLAVGLVAAAAAILAHRLNREAELRSSGVTVAGVVGAQPRASDFHSGYTWTDVVVWTYRGRHYANASRFGVAYDPAALPPVGTPVSVRVDPHDPTWYEIDGVFADRAHNTVSIGLVIVPAVVALLVGALLAFRALRLRAVLTNAPWHAATVAAVRRAYGGHRVVTESDLTGDDPQLPLTVRRSVAAEGHPVWIAFGADAYVYARPGAFGLRWGRLPDTRA